MSLREEIIADAADAFNEVRADLSIGTRFFLLKRGGETQKFAVVFEITTNFWSSWDRFREQTTFMWAESGAEWLDRVAQTSFVAYGVPDAQSKLDVFSISPDQRDRVAPTDGNLIWKLFGVRNTKERFPLPSAD